MYILNTTTWIETSLQTKCINTTTWIEIHFKQNVYSKHYNLNRNTSTSQYRNITSKCIMYILNTTTWIETSLQTKLQLE